VNKVLPHFEKLEDKHRLKVLRALALSSPSINPTEARNVLPTFYDLMLVSCFIVFNILKKEIYAKKTKRRRRRTND